MDMALWSWVSRGCQHLGVHSFPFCLTSSLWSRDQASIENRSCPDTWHTDIWLWGHLKGFYYFLLTFQSHNIILNHSTEWKHSSSLLDPLCAVESLVLYVQDLSRSGWDFSCIVFHMFGKKSPSSVSNLAESWNAGNIFSFLMKYSCMFTANESIALELFLCVHNRGFPHCSFLSIYRLWSTSLQHGLSLGVQWADIRANSCGSSQPM